MMNKKMVNKHDIDLLNKQISRVSIMQDPRNDHAYYACIYFMNDTKEYIIRLSECRELIKAGKVSVHNLAELQKEIASREAIDEIVAKGGTLHL